MVVDKNSSADHEWKKNELARLDSGFFSSYFLEHNG